MTMNRWEVYLLSLKSKKKKKYEHLEEAAKLQREVNLSRAHLYEWKNVQLIYNDKNRMKMLNQKRKNRT